MSLKLYLNGTPGGTDGTEITSLTFKNFKNYMKGSGSSLQHFSILPVYIREESGYKASNVIIRGKIVDGQFYSMCSRAYSEYPTSGISTEVYGDSLGEIGSTNKLIFMAVLAEGNIASDTELFTISSVEDVAS